MTAKEKFQRLAEAVANEKATARRTWEANYPTQTEDDFRAFWVGWLESAVTFNSLKGAQIELS